jgi:N-carbamoylputrescine amidase
MPCVEGERKINFDKASALLDEVANVEYTEFVLLPELFAIGFRHEDYAKVGAGIPGETSLFLEKLAEERGAYVLASGIEAAGSKFYNTLVVTSPTGKTIAKYSKIHPFQEEKDVFRGGEEIVLLEVSGIKVGDSLRLQEN